MAKPIHNFMFITRNLWKECVAATGVARNFDWGGGGRAKPKNFVTLFW